MFLKTFDIPKLCHVLINIVFQRSLRAKSPQIAYFTTYISQLALIIFILCIISTRSPSPSYRSHWTGYRYSTKNVSAQSTLQQNGAKVTCACWPSANQPQKHIAHKRMHISVILAAYYSNFKEADRLLKNNILTCLASRARNPGDLTERAQPYCPLTVALLCISRFI